MRTVLIPTLLAALMALSSCRPGGPISWPDVVECGPSVDDLLPTVSRLLLDGGAQGDPKRLGEAAASELEKLAVKHGADTVACLVQTLTKDWFAAGRTRMAAGARPDPAKEDGLDRGCGFLTERGVDAGPQCSASH